MAFSGIQCPDTCFDCKSLSDFNRISPARRSALGKPRESRAMTASGKLRPNKRLYRAIPMAVCGYTCVSTTEQVADALATAEQLKARKMDLIVADMGSEPVTQNGVSRMFFGMLALVAEFERDRIKERSAEGRIAKRRGGWTHRRIDSIWLPQDRHRPGRPAGTGPGAAGSPDGHADTRSPGPSLPRHRGRGAGTARDCGLACHGARRPGAQRGGLTWRSDLRIACAADRPTG
jgi:hypothetical protein